MDYCFTVTYIIFVSLAIISCLFFIRNGLTHIFLTRVMHKAFGALDKKLDEIENFVLIDNFNEGALGKEMDEYNKMYLQVLEIVDKKLDYNKVLFSFKPLSEKYWLSDEDIKLINS